MPFFDLSNMLSNFPQELFNFVTKIYSSNNDLFNDIWQFVKYCFSALLGGFVTYYYNYRSNKKIEKNKTYISVILIRFWLIENLSCLVNLEENLKLRLIYLTSKELKDPRKNSLTVTQDFELTEKSINIDYNLIRNLCPLNKEYTVDFEQILQVLSIAENELVKINNLKSKFNSFKAKCFSEKAYESRDVSLIFNEFLESLEQFIPEWLEIIRQSKKRLDFTFNYFQQHVCLPLGTKKLGISPNPELIDNLMSSICK